MPITRSIVICVLIATLVASLPTFLIVEPPEASETFLNIILGWFIAKGSDAIAYLLGSTANSATRNEAMARATDLVVDQARAAGTGPGLPAGTATVQVTPPAQVEVTTPAGEFDIPPPPRG